MKFTTKAAAAAGSLTALSISPQDATATIVHVDNMPLSLDFTSPNGTEVDWDVDGQFGRDFYLQLQSRFMDLDSEGANGSAFVNEDFLPNDDFRNLPFGLLVGPTLATGYYFGMPGANGRTILESIGVTGIGADAEGFTSGDPGFVGFAFDANGTTLYGWAELTLDTSTPGTATISQWAYEDSGAAIAVGDTGAAAIPEPHSLAMIAMGAAGLAAWRLRRKSKVESEESSEKTTA